MDLFKSDCILDISTAIEYSGISKRCPQLLHSETSVNRGLLLNKATCNSPTVVSHCTKMTPASFFQYFLSVTFKRIEVLVEYVLLRIPAEFNDKK